VQAATSIIATLTQASCVIRAGPPAPPQPHAVQLNFEVFEEIYRHCAYDSIAFGCFFTRLSNYVLGLHDWVGLCSVTNVMNWGSILSQTADNSARCYAIEELEGHQVDHEDGAYQG
jgi:hypothetical protein